MSKVVDLERRPDMLTMLKPDNGTSLQVAAESQGPASRLRWATRSWPVTSRAAGATRSRRRSG